MYIHTSGVHTYSSVLYCTRISTKQLYTQDLIKHTPCTQFANYFYLGKLQGSHDACNVSMF